MRVVCSCREPFPVGQVVSRVGRMGDGEGAWIQRFVYKGTLEEDILNTRGEFLPGAADKANSDRMPIQHVDRFIKAMERTSTAAAL